MKKLLLGLGAIASVAAPVAAVVACGSKTPDAFATANAKISAIIAKNAAVALTKAIPASEDVHPAINTEGDFDRKIKIVNSGFVVELKGNLNGLVITRYFETNDLTVINKLFEKDFAAAEKHYEDTTKSVDKRPDAEAVQSYKFVKATPITTSMITYTDSSCLDQVLAYKPEDFTLRVGMEQSEFDEIQAVITDALATKTIA